MIHVFFGSVCQEGTNMPNTSYFQTSWSLWSNQRSDAFFMANFVRTFVTLTTLISLSVGKSFGLFAARIGWRGGHLLWCPKRLERHRSSRWLWWSSWCHSQPLCPCHRALWKMSGTSGSQESEATECWEWNRWHVRSEVIILWSQFLRDDLPFTTVDSSLCSSLDG